MMFLASLLLAASVGITQDDLDCEDFNSQAEAQQTLRDDPSDPNGLDAENDGVACETTPYENPERDEVPVQASVSPGGDRDCEDFANQQEAQAVYDQDTSDPNGLDADNDDLACEDFDYSPTGDQYASEDQPQAVATPHTGGPMLLPLAGALVLLVSGGFFMIRR